MRAVGGDLPCIRTGFFSNESSSSCEGGVGWGWSISFEESENAATERHARIAKMGTARKYALVDGMFDLVWVSGG